MPIQRQDRTDDYDAILPRQHLETVPWPPPEVGQARLQCSVGALDGGHGAFEADP
jgi:hypothetical protein